MAEVGWWLTTWKGPTEGIEKIEVPALPGSVPDVLARPAASQRWSSPSQRGQSQPHSGETGQRDGARATLTVSPTCVETYCVVGWRSFVGPG